MQPGVVKIPEVHHADDKQKTEVYTTPHVEVSIEKWWMLVTGLSLTNGILVD